MTESEFKNNKKEIVVHNLFYKDNVWLLNLIKYYKTMVKRAEENKSEM